MKTNQRWNSSGDPDEFRLTLIEHLEELRDRIIRSLFAICIGWAIGWFAFTPIYDFFNQKLVRQVQKELPGFREVWHNAPDAFFLQLKLSLLIGVVLAFPYIIYQIWMFVAPGLKPNEQKPCRKLAPVSFALFLLGVFFCWIVMPQCMQWFASYVKSFPHTDLYQEPGQLTFFLLKMMLAFGVGFQIPVIVYGLGLAGLLSAETLLQHWRHGAVAIFILAMVITPSQDPMTMLAMALPLTLLFILSVYFVKFAQRNRPADDQPDMIPLE